MRIRFWNGTGWNNGHNRHVYSNSAHVCWESRWDSWVTTPGVKRMSNNELASHLHSYKSKSQILSLLQNKDHTRRSVKHLSLLKIETNVEIVPLSRHRHQSNFRVKQPFSSLDVFAKPVRTGDRARLKHLVPALSRTADRMATFLCDVSAFLITLLRFFFHAFVRCLVSFHDCFVAEDTKPSISLLHPVQHSPPFKLAYADADEEPPSPDASIPDTISSPTSSLSDLEDEIAVEMSLLGDDSSNPDYNPHTHHTPQPSLLDDRLFDSPLFNHIECHESEDRLCLLSACLVSGCLVSVNSSSVQDDIFVIPFKSNKNDRCPCNFEDSRTWKCMPASTQVFTEAEQQLVSDQSPSATVATKQPLAEIIASHPQVALRLAKERKKRTIFAEVHNNPIIGPTSSDCDVHLGLFIPTSDILVADNHVSDEFVIGNSTKPLDLIMLDSHSDYGD